MAEGVAPTAPVYPPSYADLTPYLIQPEGDANHPRLLCMVSEKNSKGQLIRNIVAPYFDPETKLAFNDDTKKKLYLKQSGLAFQTPLNVAIKWAYHLSFLGMLVELGKTLAGDAEFKTLGNRCFRELKDMVRTPIYGIALWALALSSVFFSPFKPTYTYTVRKKYAKLELDLCHGNSKSMWIRAICFKNYNIFRPEYSSFNLAVAESADIVVGKRREGGILCNNWGIPLDPDTPYRSSILSPSDIAKAEKLECLTKLSIDEGNQPGQ